MANVSRVNGFRPVRYKNGSPYNGGFTHYVVSAGDTTALFVGDLVTRADNTVDTENYVAVTQTAASGAAIGAIVGFEIDPANLNSPMYRAASTRRVVFVADDPNIVFEAQEDGDTDPLELQDIGLNVNLIVAAGNTITGSSGMTIDSSTHTTTTAMTLKLIGASKRVDNEVGADGTAAAKWYVMINNHQLSTGTGVQGV